MGQRYGLTEELHHFFSEFEDNMGNELGGGYLIDALECAQKVLMESNNEMERRKTNNIIKTYRGIAIERAKALCTIDIPDSRQLEYSKHHMQSFSDYGFNDDPSFDTIKSDIDTQYAKAIIFDCFGRPLDAENKAILRRIIEQIEGEKVS